MKTKTFGKWLVLEPFWKSASVKMFLRHWGFFSAKKKTKKRKGKTQSTCFFGHNTTKKKVVFFLGEVRLVQPTNWRYNNFFSEWPYNIQTWILKRESEFCLRISKFYTIFGIHVSQGSTGSDMALNRGKINTKNSAGFLFCIHTKQCFFQDCCSNKKNETKICKG